MKFPKPPKRQKTLAQLQYEAALKKKHKYSAEKVHVPGQSYASKLEARVHQMLQARERAGEIAIERVQDQVRLTDADVLYVPDYRCRDLKSGEVFWVEAKGVEVGTWRLKRRLWGTYGPGRLEVWFAGGGTFGCHLHEVITPKDKKR